MNDKTTALVPTSQHTYEPGKLNQFFELVFFFLLTDT